MWLSMTGYGRSVSVAGNMQITAEIRAINHRYQEIVLRSPRELAALEERMRKLLQGSFLRGRLELSIGFRHTGAQYNVRVQPELALAYLSGMKQLANIAALPAQISLSELAALPDVLTIERLETDPEEIWSVLQQAIQAAFAECNAMRAAEGARLHDDLCQRLDQVRTLCAEIEKLAPRSEREYQARLQQRLQELLDNLDPDQGRILQEVAIWAERTSITEELVRLTSHIAQFSELLSASGEAVGRRADFLLQEMNREINTIGSKANDLKISQLVIELKAELEKIREQVQNIE